MIKLTTISRTVITLALSVVLAGCASLQNTEQLGKDSINIVRTHSQIAKIGYISVRNDDTGSLILGKLHSQKVTRGPIFGRLVIEVQSPKGETLFNGPVSYMRKDHKSKIAKFSLKLDTKIEKKSTIKVTHSE